MREITSLPPLPGCNGLHLFSITFWQLLCGLVAESEKERVERRYEEGVREEERRGVQQRSACLLIPTMRTINAQPCVRNDEARSACAGYAVQRSADAWLR